MAARSLPAGAGVSADAIASALTPAPAGKLRAAIKP